MNYIPVFFLLIFEHVGTTTLIDYYVETTMLIDYCVTLKHT